MDRKNELSDKWIKASITGTLWAASEIVLGSFLHNLKVPFSGNILTAIGVIILISVSYIWTEKGLFWRAGLICAIMKTMSPSAIIFGPMVAIFSEAALMEISVRLLGKTLAGYILGAMLAMSWNLFQKIMNFIIFYGFNIVDLYTNLIKFAQKQLNINFDIVWLPPIVLLIFYCIFGIIAALIGIKIGRQILKQPSNHNTLNVNGINSKNQIKIKPEFRYSMLWLFADLVLLTGSLVLLSYASWIYWSVTVLAIVTIWAFRYRGALRKLSKPKFWIFFVLITMLTAFVFTSVMTGSKSVLDGMLLGLQMNFRAIIIIAGFSVLGTELYNPVIRGFFLKTYFKQLPLALELSFESLPSMIANIPDFKTIMKNPVSVFNKTISQVEIRLAEIKEQSRNNRKIFIMTGSREQGKTTQLQKIIGFLKENEIAVGGIYSPRVMENNETIGYDIVDVTNNEREIFLRHPGDENLAKIGRFSVYPSGLQKGVDSLGASSNLNNKIVIIDEAGLLELQDQGWAGSIQNLLNESDKHLLLVVRDSFVEKIIHKWNLRQCHVYNISDYDYLAIGKSIIDQISRL
jgi:nucleoside-triphosphatase THEP1